VPRARIFKEKQ